MTKQLTVKELRKILSEFVREGHGDAVIHMEGCDCYGACKGAYVSGPPHGIVYLERD